MMRHDRTTEPSREHVEAVAPSSDEVRTRLHAAREAKGKAPVDCWACEAFDEVIALLWEMHQAGYEQGLAGCASTVERLRAEIRDRESERADLRDRVQKAEAQVARVEALAEEAERRYRAADRKRRRSAQRWRAEAVAIRAALKGRHE